MVSKDQQMVEIDGLHSAYYPL